jgi:nitrite reductase/ring-hydroxylating ferredoxin subunit
MSPSWRDRPNAPASGTPLCTLDEVPGDNGLERVFGAGDRAFRVVLFKVGDGAGGLRAYVNECPHVNIPYEFSADVFCVYEIEGRRDLMCAHHTAMFHLDDGRCYDGPCKGERLIAVDVDVDVEAGTVRIA